MTSSHAIAAHWQGGFDEARIREWVEGLREKLAVPTINLGLVFMTPPFFDHAREVLEILRVHGRISLLAGCSSQSLIANSNEIEENAGLVLELFATSGGVFKGVAINQEALQSTTQPSNWHQITGVLPTNTRGWLAFADPFHLDGETWLREWNQAYPRIPTIGGLASGHPEEQRTQLYLNGDVYEEGAVLISVGGSVALESVTSQGCTPIGDAWTITKAEKNYIVTIANRPAYHVLLDTYNSLSQEEQRLAQNNLFIGFASSEYRDEFHRGDFLVRNLLSADPKRGVLAVGAWPRAGQTVQFHRRDASAATEDLNYWLERTRTLLTGRTVYGACLCCCNGRGARLFGKPNHDAGLVQEQLGPIPMAGFFCNGELGPVGEKNFLHGYTASLALFVKAE